MKIVNHAKNLTLLGRSTLFYEKMLMLVTEELPTWGMLTATQQQVVLNSLGLTIVHLPIDMAVKAMEIVLNCNADYLKLVRKSLIGSKADCEKVRIINSYLVVTNPNNIITLLCIQWPLTTVSKKETFACDIATFIRYHSYFKEKPTPLWDTILKTITKTKNTGGGSTLANKHLKEAEKIISQRLERNIKDI